MGNHHRWGCALLWMVVLCYHGCLPRDPSRRSLVETGLDIRTGFRHKNRNTKDKKTSKVIANCDNMSVNIESFIHTIRGQKVMIDFDLAMLYGVTTSHLNEQVKRNIERFPEDFMFQLTKEEWNILRSQIATTKDLIINNVTSTTAGNQKERVLLSQIAISKPIERGGGTAHVYSSAISV